MSEEPTAVAEGRSALDCQLCGAALRPQTAFTVGGHVTCQACLDQLEAEIAEGEVDGARLPAALLGSLLGALVGAAVWAGIVIATDYEIGYVAVLVGFLAGKGAALATRGGHGPLAQKVAVVGALFGLVAAKFAIFAHVVKQFVFEEHGELIGYFDEQILANFPDFLVGEMTGLFDLLWIFLAVTTAWRGPASPTLHVARP
jgi:hypothetical protein